MSSFRFSRTLWLVLTFATLLLLGFSIPSHTASASAALPQSAPLLDTHAPNKIKGQYIVVFKDNLSASQMQKATKRVSNKFKGTILYEYRAALNGFAAKLDKKALRKLRKNPRVAFIEQDKRVSINDGYNVQADSTTLDTSQTGATWGLDRIDQRNLPLNSTYNYTPTGAGVNAYVIDTGIRITHSQFAGRAFSGYDAVGDGNGTNDCNGHGTHVSGTIGGSTYGVAKGVKLYAVRVLDCTGSGSDSGVIAGINWVTANRVKPAVANMSLGGGLSASLDTAVRNSINAGVVYSIAGGNSNTDACTQSPADTAEAITVGATTSTDARASYSNYGTCLDLFAPGSSITSSWNTSDTATNTISGTSMATPHVTGVAALYLQTNPTASAQTVRDAIVNNATANLVTSPGTGSPNKLLYSIFGAAGPTPTPTRTATPIPGGTNVVKNPGFESGSNGNWTESSSGGYQIIDTTRPHTGSYSAYFCGYNSCTEYIEQSIVVPANATLTYWWYQTSGEGTTTAYDYLYVQVYNSSGTLLATPRTWSNKNTRGAWAQDTISLAAYAGQTIRLRFTGKTDTSLPSTYFVDDVSVK